MPDLLDQIQSFSMTLMVGIIVGTIIHYYQLTIRKSRLHKYFLYCIDFILWILLIGIIFICLLLINMGEMRAYVLIALFMGILLYYRFLARYMHRPLDWAAQATIAFISLGKRVLAQPFVWLAIRIRSLRPQSQEEPPDENG
ncbi:MAG TPA: spore cortex biosynthesis protein YabQ [Syntrophomonadaceae bacterium]|nr:spore cortex biosynthesis protein YabQ [Syntrophomonadaceae bacterium]